MSSNRLLPFQSAPGIDASATRIEQSLLALAELCDDVPADLLRRRWSPSHALWGFTPPSVASPSPFLGNFNFSFGGPQSIAFAQLTNPYRCKSCQADGITVANGGQLLTWEVSMLATHPIIIGSLVVMAAKLAAQFWSDMNPWQYGNNPPTGHANGDPTEDFTLQVCVSDGWDLENRKKLRQESLTYKMRSDAFAFSPITPPGPNVSDTTLPPMPLWNGVGVGPCAWNGFAVMADALVLVPVGARIVFQWTIPFYPDANNASWGAHPVRGNIWNLRALTYSPTRK